MFKWYFLRHNSVTRQQYILLRSKEVDGTVKSTSVHVNSGEYARQSLLFPI